MMIISKKKFLFSTLFIFALLISIPLFSTELVIRGHDSGFHFMRMEGIYESLSGGQFPVRIVGYSFNTYGEMSGIFYPNLFFYIPALFRFCGLSMTLSYN